MKFGSSRFGLENTKCVVWYAGERAISQTKFHDLVYVECILLNKDRTVSGQISKK